MLTGVAPQQQHLFQFHPSFLGLPRSTAGRHAALAKLGETILLAWCGSRPLTMPTLRPADVLVAASMNADPPLLEAVAIVGSHLQALGGLTEQSEDRLMGEVGRFVRRLEFSHVRCLSEVDSSYVVDFLDEAVLVGGIAREPATGTKHLRRSAVRLLFRSARQLHLVGFDPTIDIVLPRRSDLTTRPLTDDEEMLGRLASRHTLTATRLPAAWALGQATAISSEMATVTGGDVDRAASRVWLHGSSNRVARWGRLTDWGLQQVMDRLEELGDPGLPLVYAARTSAKSGQTVSCEAVRDVLVRAGLRQEPDVRPGSLAAWAGRRAFNSTGRIEDVAKLLGLRSLDRAARVIGWDWS